MRGNSFSLREMVELELTADDLAATRFAISPLWELVSSLGALRKPLAAAAHLPWAKATLPRLLRLDRELFSALASPRGWTPDFLTPQPGPASLDPAAELAALRRLDPRRVLPDFREAYQEAPLPAVLTRHAKHPEDLLERVVDLVESYWSLALAEHWPRMQTLLRADVVHRTRQVADGGFATLFADLDPKVRWSGDRLRIAIGPDLHRARVDGRGLALVPCVFAVSPLVNIDVGLPPVVAYPARGAGSLWEDTATAEGALVDLLGRGRAAVLNALSAPRSTSDLSRALELSPGAVSQHLSVLARAGLVVRARHGRSVLYSPTLLGERVRDIT